MIGDVHRQIATGVPGLDTLLRGGLPRGHLYLLSGPSGAGKTTLGLQFLMEGARHGERVLYCGSSETEDEIQLIGRSHGWDLAGLQIRHNGTETSTGGGRQTMLHPAEVELPRTIEQLMRVVEDVGPERLVIDSLSEIRILAREENWFRQQIKALQEKLASGGCTVLVTDLFLENQSVLRSSVHGVIELEQQARVYGPDRRRLRLVKMRGMAHATGYHDVAIETGGLRVFPRLTAADHRRRHSPECVSSGIAELDAMLGGGIDRGVATLFMGPTGTGKSTLAVHCVVAAARRGEKSAMYIFDERVQTLFQRAAGLGLELEEHVRAGLIAVRQVDPVELTPGQFTQEVIDAAAAGARMVVIDSLNGYAYAMPEERLLGLHLHELVSHLNQQGVTSLQVMTPHVVFGPPHMDIDVSYIADTLIVLRPFEFAGTVRHAIAVHKRRAGDHEKTVRELKLQEGRIVIGQPLQQFAGIITGQLNYLGDPTRSREDSR